jgi:hypothetical protein
MTPESTSIKLAAALPVDLSQWLYDHADEGESMARSFAEKQPELADKLRREATLHRMAARELRLTLAECKRLRGLLTLAEASRKLPA